MRWIWGSATPRNDHVAFLVEQWRDEPPGGRADDPESDMAADLIAERYQIMFDRSEFADDSAGPIGDDFPLGGEFATRPVD